MVNMRNVAIWNIHVRLQEAEARSGDHFDDLLVVIDEMISEYETEHPCNPPGGSTNDT